MVDLEIASISKTLSWVDTCEMRPYFVDLTDPPGMIRRPLLARSSMSNVSPVLSVVIRRFRESDMDAANEVLVRFEQALRQQLGFIEIRHDAPSKETGELFSTVIAFETLSDLVAWEQSPTREELVRELAQYIEGDVMKNRLWDLDSLLGNASVNHPPKKWKTVLVLTFWVLVVGAVLGWLFDVISPDYPSGYPRTVVLLIINILLNSYFFLPRSMAFLHRLEAGRAKGVEK